MPDFTGAKKPSPTPTSEEMTRVDKRRIKAIIEPRCKVCQSPKRSEVDKLLARFIPYTEIARIFDDEQFERRSISNHAQKHLGWEEAAIRQIVEEDAKTMRENAEEGITNALRRRLYLNVGVQKAYEAMMSGDVMIEPKDAVNMIMLASKLDSEHSEAALEELQAQFSAFMQAVKEVVPAEYWTTVVQKTQGILETKRLQIRQLEEGHADAVEVSDLDGGFDTGDSGAAEDPAT